MIYLQDRPPKVLNNVLEKAKFLKFMPSTDGTLHSVNNLFDPTSNFLKNLLYGEGVFPNENFIQENGINQSFLQSLGLKTEDNISSDDVVQVATSIHMFVNGMEEKKNTKAEKLISYLKEHEEHIKYKALQKIKGLKWVPIEHEKPDDYPYKLGWYGSKTFCSPDEVKSMQFKNLNWNSLSIGNAWICSQNRLLLVISGVKNQNQMMLLNTIEMLSNSYERRQNAEYLHITKHIIGYLFKLWEAGTLNDETIKKLNAMDYIPTNSQGFKSAHIVVQEIRNKHINYILEPYIFELARDVADFSKLFIELGMKGDVDFHVLKSLLQRISAKYMSEEETPADKNELEKDQTLTYNILKSIVDMEINKSELSEILIPINSSREELHRF
ncbi:Hypothetical predicted protein [Mytilus galloprovincialis]|uniref:Uncharacterized protein n=1 Tax=Mytilus galloprovincialis TaxID=29158 RepID=A0A8B6CP16_MYTGA|nr:Hypothetical predicted protein [Mytilus galloprovincialis]